MSAPGQEQTYSPAMLQVRYAADISVTFAQGHPLKSSFNQMETPAHFSFNRAHGPIR
jgi:hypothetical protein